MKIRLDSTQRKAFADWLLKFALFWLTSLPVSLVLNANHLPWYVMVSVSVFGLMILAFGLALSKKDKEDVMHTEVKKGVFHIDNAEIRK